MNNLTPEKRTELRDAVEERHLFRFATERGSDGYPSSGFLEISREVLALLDAADERDRLAAAAERVRALHRPGDIMTWAEDCDDPDGHEWTDDPRGGGMLCADEITGTYCMGCAPDYTPDVSDYPHPCPTLRTLDGTDDGPTT